MQRIQFVQQMLFGRHSFVAMNCCGVSGTPDTDRSAIGQSPTPLVRLIFAQAKKRGMAKGQKTRFLQNKPNSRTYVSLALFGKLGNNLAKR